MLRLVTSFGRATLSLPYRFQSQKPPASMTQVNGYYSRCKPCDTDCSHIRPCPDDPPEEPPASLSCKCKKYMTYLIASLSATAVMLGAFLVYAKSDPELRDWFTILTPWLDDFVALAWQENASYRNAIQYCLEYVGLAKKKTVEPCDVDDDDD